MDKLIVNVKLNQIKGTFRLNIQKNGTSEDYICIPTKELSLDDRNVWLNMLALPNEEYSNQSHILMQLMSRGQYANNSKAPCLGQVKHARTDNN